jgi:hypothetical protein
MLRTLTAATLLAVAGASLAQTQAGQTAPSIPASETPAVTPTQTPAATPSGRPPAPVIEERPVGGLSKCENALAFDREKCLQEERAAAARSARPGSTATGGAGPR